MNRSSEKIGFSGVGNMSSPFIVCCWVHERHFTPCLQLFLLLDQKTGYVLNRSLLEKSAGRVALRCFWQGSHVSLMASLQPLPSLFPPVLEFILSTLSIIYSCIIFFIPMVSAQTQLWPLCTSNYVSHCARHISNRTLLFYHCLLPRPSPFCLSLAVTDYGCHRTSPDTKGTWGQEAWRQVVSQTSLSLGHLWTGKIPRMHFAGMEAKDLFSESVIVTPTFFLKKIFRVEFDLPSSSRTFNI